LFEEGRKKKKRKSDRIRGVGARLIPERRGKGEKRWGKKKKRRKGGAGCSSAPHVFLGVREKRGKRGEGERKKRPCSS